MSKKVSILVVIMVVTLSGGFIVHQTMASGIHVPIGRGLEHGSAISGTVVAISGNVLSVNASSTVYSVDVSGARIIKNINGVIGSATVSSIAVGDTIRVEGTISGANVAAKMIFDGELPPMGPMMHGGLSGMKGHGFPHGPFKGRVGSTTRAMMIKGDRISGNVSVISGTTLTIASSTATYTIDASHARFSGSNHRKGTLGAIQIDDSVNVFGIESASNTNSINAFMIEDASRSF